MTDEIEAWIAAKEAAAREVLTLDHPSITESIRGQMEETLVTVGKLREMLAKAERYGEVCASNAENARSATKKLKTRERNILMAQEFKKRATRRDIFRTNRSDTALATEIGRQFHVKRSAAHAAIKAGLVELDRRNVSSGQRRKVD